MVFLVGQDGLLTAQCEVRIKTFTPLSGRRKWISEGNFHKTEDSYTLKMKATKTLQNVQCEYWNNCNRSCTFCMLIFAVFFSCNATDLLYIKHFLSLLLQHFGWRLWRHRYCAVHALFDVWGSAVFSDQPNEAQNVWGNKCGPKKKKKRNVEAEFLLSLFVLRIKHLLLCWLSGCWPSFISLPK